MKIAIAQRYRPFSHEPGVTCLLPLSSWTVQAFPTLIRLRDREWENSSGCFEISLALHGPIKEFTLQQDLEKGSVFIWGIAQEGRFRLRLEAVMGTIKYHVEKAPATGIICDGKKLVVNDYLSWSVAGAFLERPKFERLSLGSHRSQNWADVWRRMDLREIIPILFHLSQWTPKSSQDLGNEIIRLIDDGFEAFLRTGFFGILSPRLVDDEFQGLISNQTNLDRTSSLALILAAKEKIRSRFIEQKGMQVSLLPHSDFIAGRFIDVQLPQIGTLDFEWTKGRIRQVIIHAQFDAKIQLQLPSNAVSFRLREGRLDRGCRKTVDTELDLVNGKKYFLDQFQK